MSHAKIIYNMNTLYRNFSRASSISLYIGIFVILLSVFGIGYQVFFFSYFVVIVFLLGIPILLSLGLILFNPEFSDFAKTLIEIDTSSIKAISVVLKTYSLPLLIISLSLLVLTIILTIFSQKNSQKTFKFVVSSLLIVLTIIIFVFSQTVFLGAS